MEPQKNLRAQIPLSLHAKVREEQEKAGLPLSAYITQLLTDYFENDSRKGDKNMEFTKTLAFQIPEELFNQIKEHLEREKQRTGKRLTQRDFVIGLIERELETAERRDAQDEAEPPNAATEPEDGGEQE